MKTYRADLHIHTVLSPCGDLDMSPAHIIREAKHRQLDIIGITDHNSTLHGPLMRRLGKKNDLLVLTGAEVTTREEVHCLTFFENDDLLDDFQQYLDSYLPYIPNDPRIFGYQVVVDARDKIRRVIPSLLITGLNQTLEEVEKKVHTLGGLFIPAHINKGVNSLLANLGFLPPSLKVDALEVCSNLTQTDWCNTHPEFGAIPLVRNSDAHQTGDIGKFYNAIPMPSCSFKAIRDLLGCKEKAIIQWQ